MPQPDIERLDLKRSKFYDWTRLPLVPHICDSEMGKHCRLFGVKPLPEPISGNCELDS